MDIQVERKIKKDLIFLLNNGGLTPKSQRDIVKMLIEIIPDSGLEELVDSLLDLYIFHLDRTV
jgi:hypothetical protein